MGMEMTAQTSLFMIDASTVVKRLAQLWNLLKEEDVLSQAWPDIRFLLNVMGDKFFFKTVRPVLKDDTRSNPVF